MMEQAAPVLSVKLISSPLSFWLFPVGKKSIHLKTWFEVNFFIWSRGLQKFKGKKLIECSLYVVPDCQKNGLSWGRAERCSVGSFCCTEYQNSLVWHCSYTEFAANRLVCWSKSCLICLVDTVYLSLEFCFSLGFNHFGIGVLDYFGSHTLYAD